MNDQLTHKKRRIAWDWDNTIVVGPLSFGTLYKGFKGKRPEITIANSDSVEQFLNGEYEKLPEGWKSNALRFALNFTHFHLFRPKREAAQYALEQLSSQHGVDSMLILSGRPFIYLDEATQRAVELVALSKFLQGGVYLKPTEFNSASWKASVLIYLANKFPEEEIDLIDNDLLASIEIAQVLIARGIKNVRIFLREGIELHPFILKLIEIGELPKNITTFRSFKELPQKMELIEQ